MIRMAVILLLTLGAVGTTQKPTRLPVATTSSGII